MAEVSECNFERKNEASCDLFRTQPSSGLRKARFAVFVLFQSHRNEIPVRHFPKQIHRGRDRCEFLAKTFASLYRVLVRTAITVAQQQSDLGTLFYFERLWRVRCRWVLKKNVEYAIRIRYRCVRSVSS